MEVRRARGWKDEELPGRIGIWNEVPSSSMHQIYVDGRLVNVGENLENALRVLRESPKVQAGARVWVDSLCINQADIEEKNLELKRIGSIYRKVKRVVPWLGPEEERSGDALEVLSAFGEALTTS
jgi:hypothetical protein